MKSIILVLLITFSGTASAQLKLELTTAQNVVTECEPHGITIAWTNVSKDPLRIGPERSPSRLASVVTVIVNGQPRQQVEVVHMDVDYAIGAKDTLDPGERVEGGYSAETLDLASGTYRIKAVADFSRAAEGYFRGHAESNTIDFMLKLPMGEDLNAWQFASQQVSSQAEQNKEKFTRNEERNQICGFLGNPVILKFYPNSIYAAWILYNSFDRPENWEPSKLKELIKNGGFPHRDWIPDADSPDNEMREIALKDLPQWQIDSAELILKTHPDFPYSDSLHLLIAANSVVMGNREKAISELSKVSQKQNTKEAQWAKAFAALQN